MCVWEAGGGGEGALLSNKITIPYKVLNIIVTFVTPMPGKGHEHRGQKERALY